MGRALVPAWIRGYDRQALRPDLLAGLTVLAYIVPQVLAYAGLIGLPPMAGLTTAVVALVVYAFLGTSRMISVGPEATVALMGGLVLAPLVAAHPDQAVGLTAALTLLVGIWLGFGGIGKAGVISQLLSKPILTGYMTGVGVLMMSSQLGKITGTDSSGDTVLLQVSSFLAGLHAVHWPTLWATVAALSLLFLLPLLDSRIPAALVVICVADGLSGLLDGAGHGLRELGRIPQGPPPITMPSFEYGTLQALVLGSLGISLVAFSSMMLVARAFAAPGEEVNADRELTAAAAVHVIGAFVGAYPSSASGTRSAIARSAGQRTQLSGIVTAIGVALVVLLAGPLFEHLPTAALAAVVLWAATKLILVHDYRVLWQFRRAEFGVAVTTAVGTAIFGILAGIGFAVALSAVQILAALARPHEAIQGYVVGKAGLHDVDDYADHVTIPGLLIYRYDGPLFAYNADDFRVRLTRAILDYAPRWVLLNVEANMFVDYSACAVLREIIEEQQAQGRVVGLARLKLDLRTQLEGAGIIDLIGDRTFETLPQAIKAYHEANPDIVLPPIPAAGERFDPDAPAGAI
jgi:high affinity sulfate transporter 1